MDAQNWDECNDPEQLFVTLRGRLTQEVAWRLACAFCRRLWNRLDGEYQIGRAVIEMAERSAEGAATPEDLQALWQEFCKVHYQSHRKFGREDPLEPISYLFP